MKYKRSVPQGRARKEFYQLAIDRDLAVTCFYTGLFNYSYMDSKTLGTWEYAGAGQAQREAGRSRDPAHHDARPNLKIVLLFYSQLYYGQGHQVSLRQWFLCQLPQGTAILVHHAVTGRFKQAAATAPKDQKQDYSHVSTFRDAASVFPSVSHASTQRTIRANADQWDTSQMCARHEQMQARVNSSQGVALILQPCSGGRGGAGR